MDVTTIIFTHSMNMSELRFSDLHLR